MTYPSFEYDTRRPIDLICMGRVAVDLYAEQIGCSLKDASTFKKYLGGCAGNIAVGTARLGLSTMMFSGIGQDEMGDFLFEALEKEGVNTDLIVRYEHHLTGLVLLGIQPPDRFPLLFYRNECADMQITAADIHESTLQQAKAIMVTGTGLSTEFMRQNTLQVAALSKNNATRVILDLDFRPVLWGLTSLGNGESRYCVSEKVSAVYQSFLPYCDLIVGTEEEFLIAGGCEEINKALQRIRRLTDAPLVLKQGARGAQVIFSSGETFHSKPFPVDILNVLGAGDGFIAGLLAGLLQGASWQIATTYANACGALVVTRHGCSVAIPYKDELTYFIQHYDENPEIWKSSTLAQLHNKARVKPAPLIRSPQGFCLQVNPIITMESSLANPPMSLSSLKLSMGQMYTLTQCYEFAALLMTGKVIFHYANQQYRAERGDYFSEEPVVLHCAAGEKAWIEALTDCEILLIETENNQFFVPLIFDKTNSLELDERGKGILEDTSYRLVRTVFDKRNRPESNLVLGEIITFQGRWSSYPSHDHPQPEVYHYRFSEPQGYAFGEQGEKILRIKHYDTYQIASGETHAHCTAPGYALYTLWFIRHLPSNPYILPTFQAEHEWTKTKQANLRAWHHHGVIHEV